MLNFLADIIKIGLLVGYVAFDFRISIFYTAYILDILQQVCIIGLNAVL
jgi:hypothetical protein